MSAAPLPDLAGFRSALIVKPSSLGDIVHTLPAVQALRAAFPHLRIRWLANTEWTPLLLDNPAVDEVIAFPRKTFRGLYGLARFAAWAAHWRKLPRPQPEIALDFQGLLRSAVLARLSGACPVVGLSDSREGARLLHDHVVAVDPGAHALDRNLALIRAFGLEPATLETPLPTGSRPAGWPERDDVLVVHPWSRGHGKSLAPEVLQALCDALAPAAVALVGLPGHEPLPRGNHLIDLSGRTSLPELVWCLRQARAVISVDSGPMHIAAAINPRTLGIHTWSDPRQVGPHAPTARVWKAGRIAARGDFSPGECASTQVPGIDDARRLADFVRTWPAERA